MHNMDNSLPFPLRNLNPNPRTDAIPIPSHSPNAVPMRNPDRNPNPNPNPNPRFLRFQGMQRSIAAVQPDSDSSSEICDPTNMDMEDVDSSSVLSSPRTIASTLNSEKALLPFGLDRSFGQCTAEVVDRRTPKLLFLPGISIIKPSSFGNSIQNLNGLDPNMAEVIQSKTTVGLDEGETSARRLPRSPWMSFPNLFRILKTKISSTDWKNLFKVYIDFKAGRVHRAFLVKRLRSVVGDDVLYRCIRSMQRPPQSPTNGTYFLGAFIEDDDPWCLQTDEQTQVGRATLGKPRYEIDRAV